MVFVLFVSRYRLRISNRVIFVVGLISLKYLRVFAFELYVRQSGIHEKAKIKIDFLLKFIALPVRNETRLSKVEYDYLFCPQSILKITPVEI